MNYTRQSRDVHDQAKRFEDEALLILDQQKCPFARCGRKFEGARIEDVAYHMWRMHSGYEKTDHIILSETELCTFLSWVVLNLDKSEWLTHEV